MLIYKISKDKWTNDYLEMWKTLLARAGYAIEENFCYVYIIAENKYDDLLFSLAEFHSDIFEECEDEDYNII